MENSSRVISIPAPCHENWDAMTPAQQGRHCGACQKTVIDFTMMSDGQILDVLRRNNRPCGRYRASQLDRALVDNRRKPAFLGVISGRVAALLLLFQSIGIVAKAQEEKKDSTEQRTDNGEKKVQVKVIRKDSIKLDYSISMTAPELVSRVRAVTIQPDVALMGFAVSGTRSSAPLFKMPSLKPSLLPKTTTMWKRLTDYWAGKDTKTDKL